MHPLYASFLLAFAVTAVVAEIITLAFPEKLLGLLEPENAVSLPRWLLAAMALLSICYLLAIGLMLFSGDKVFRIYAFLLMTLSAAGWALRKRIRHIRALVTVDSTLCLIILIDTIRSVLRMLSILT